MRHSDRSSAADGRGLYSLGPYRSLLSRRQAAGVCIALEDGQDIQRSDMSGIAEL